MLKALPFREPDRLVVLWEEKPSINKFKLFVAVANYREWRRSESFDSMAAIQDLRVNLIAGPNGHIDPEEIRAEKVSASLFPTLGVQPLIGRAFRGDEETPGHDGVVLLSYDLWARRFAADRGIVGKTIQLGTRVYTVTGVMPPRFAVMEPEVQVWVPLGIDLNDARTANYRMLSVVARLKPGVGIETARAEMLALGARLEAADRALNQGYCPSVYSMREQIVGNVKQPLVVIACAVGLLLLLACTNVANLLLARGTSRQKEMAIRMALGAGWWTVVRQLVAEGLVLSVAGGVLGLAVAAGGVRGLATLGARTVPNLAHARLDLRLFAFALAVSAATGLFFGLVPAVQVSGRRVNAALSDTARGGTMSRSGRRLRDLLVMTEIALAVVLLIGAGLLVRTFLRLRSYQVGFQPEGVLTLRLPLGGGRNTAPLRRVAFLNQIEKQLSALPGARGAGAVSALPLTGLGTGTIFAVQGRPAAAAGQRPIALLRAATPDYFHVLRIPLVAGRVFTAADDTRSRPVVIVDQAIARRYWPGGAAQALGNRVTIDMAPAPVTAEIVGVVGDVEADKLDPGTLSENDWPTLYDPYPQAPFSTMEVALRTDGSPRSLASAVEREVHRLDPDQPVVNLQPMESIVDSALVAPRFQTFVLCMFAGIAFVLAAVGIYGVISYDVSERVHEMGIRMALGAQERDVLALVLGQGARLAGFGIAAGMFAAVFATRLMAKMLYGVRPEDLYTFAGVALLLAAVALAASYVPSRRAMRLDPMAALRHE